MAEYFIKQEGSVRRDELFSEPGVSRLENVSVSSGAAFNRGCILCGTDGVYQPVKTVSDAKKSLVIAAADYEDVNSAVGVTCAYTSGNFHKDKLSTGAEEDLSVDNFKDALRHYSINLTTLKTF